MSDFIETSQLVCGPKETELRVAIRENYWVEVAPMADTTLIRLRIATTGKNSSNPIGYADVAMSHDQLRQLRDRIDRLLNN